MLDRVKWSNMYEGRYVTTHYNDGRLFKIVRESYVRGWSVIERVGTDSWIIRYRLYEENYNSPANYGLWDNEITRELNREFLLNKLLNETEA